MVKNKVIIIFDLDGNIWFGLKDILKMLGYTSIIKQLTMLNIDDKFIKFSKKY